MSNYSQKKWLSIAIALNIIISLGHYLHNMAFLPEYREPSWITPALIDSLWLAMTPFSILGYVFFCRNRLLLSYSFLYLYCGLSLLVLGHYAITPIWTLSLEINAIIWAEAIAALILAAYTFSLQRRSRYNVTTS